MWYSDKEVPTSQWLGRANTFLCAIFAKSSVDQEALPHVRSSFTFFMTVLGLHCFVQAFSRFSKQGLLSVAVWELLTDGAPLLSEHRL